MEHIIVLLQGHTGYITVGIQLFVLLILFVLLHKINSIKKRTGRLIANVERYLAVVMEEETGEELQREKSRVKSSHTGLDEKAQSDLIAKVLQEIFP